MKTYYDKNGIPIHPGDLLRSFHFRDATHRGKIRHLYHVACLKGEYMAMVPVSQLDQSRSRKFEGGECLLNQGLASETEVICGYGDDGVIFDEREKRSSTEAT